MQTKIVIIVLALLFLLGGGFSLKSNVNTNKAQEVASDGHTGNSHVATITKEYLHLQRQLIQHINS